MTITFGASVLPVAAWLVFYAVELWMEPGERIGAFWRLLPNYLMGLILLWVMRLIP